MKKPREVKVIDINAIEEHRKHRLFINLNCFILASLSFGCQNSPKKQQNDSAHDTHKIDRSVYGSFGFLYEGKSYEFSPSIEEQENCYFHIYAGEVYGRLQFKFFQNDSDQLRSIYLSDKIVNGDKTRQIQEKIESISNNGFSCSDSVNSHKVIKQSGWSKLNDGTSLVLNLVVWGPFIWPFIPFALVESANDYNFHSRIKKLKLGMSEKDVLAIMNSTYSLRFPKGYKHIVFHRNNTGFLAIFDSEGKFVGYFWGDVSQMQIRSKLVNTRFPRN